ncbi:MAG: prepilin-type N-terminal cleavage/methylation domain-containing protein [Hyphomicrobiales bacterium]
MKIKSFTLTELLVVLLIIGILILLALPNLMPLISRAKSTEAQLQLEHLYTLEKSHFYLHSKYSGDLQDIGFEQSKLVSDGGHANYIIEVIEFDQGHFLGRATSITDFDGDGTFNVWEIDEDKNIKEVIKD